MIFYCINKGLLMIDNKKFYIFISHFLLLTIYCPTVSSYPNTDILPVHIQQVQVQRVPIQRDSLLASVAVIGAGAASYLGTKALEHFLYNECTGQCSAYVGAAAFAAVASGCSIARYMYPDRLPNKHQMIQGLRDAARAIAFATLRR